MSERRYDEKDVGAILKRASELQSVAVPEGDSGGVTLQELQRIAAEVGIEPNLIARAAQEQDSKTDIVVPGDSTTSFLLDRSVDGVLSDESWQDVVMSLRRHTGRPGTSTENGLSREWSGATDVSNVTLTTSERNGRTRFRLLADYTSSAVLAWILGPTFTFLATIAIGAILSKKGAGSLNAWIAAISVASVGLLTTHFGVRRSMRKAGERVNTLLNSIVGLVQPKTEIAPTSEATSVETETVQRLQS